MQHSPVASEDSANPPGSPGEHDPPSVNADGLASVVVDSDLLCRTCGYNLRGLSLRGECPECRTPVHRALHGDRLSYSDPRWVRMLARGMWLLNAALGCSVVLIVLLLLVQPLREHAWLPTSLALALGGIAVAGAWLVTQRDPADTERDPPVTWRRTLRVAIIAAVALEAFDDVLAHSTDATRGLTAAASLLGSAMWIIVILAAFRHAISLARRIPDPDLVSQTHGTMWGLICSYGLASIIGALMLSPANFPPVLTMLFGLSCTVIVACVIFTLWSMSLIARYAHTLRHAADDAELTWKYGKAPTVET